MKTCGIAYLKDNNPLKIYENDKGIKFVIIKGKFERFDPRKVWKFKWNNSNVIIDGIDISEECYCWNKF